jgi:adenine phosphoribosyltransferase
MIGGLLPQAFGLSLCTALMMQKLQACSDFHEFDAVLAPEATAFLFAGPVAVALNKPVLVARKSVLPGKVDRAACNGSNMANLMKNGSNATMDAAFYLIADSIIPGQKILIVDDCLASGSTLDCLVRLTEMQGGEAKVLACIMELPDLGGRTVARERKVEVLSLLQFAGR